MWMQAAGVWTYFADLIFMKSAIDLYTKEKLFHAFLKKGIIRPWTKITLGMLA